MELFPFLQSYEDLVRRCPSRNQEMGSYQILNMPAPWSWTFHPLELWETKFCFYKVQSLGQEDLLEEEMASHSWYSCLENTMDRGTWCATVHGVTENGTRLSTWWMDDDLQPSEQAKTLADVSGLTPCSPLCPCQWELQQQQSFGLFLRLGTYGPADWLHHLLLKCSWLEKQLDHMHKLTNEQRARDNSEVAASLT